MELKKVSLFFRSNKLSLHALKTKFMIFSNTQAVKNSEPNIFIDFNNEGEDDIHSRLRLGQIKPTDDRPFVKFLGVLIDPSLSYQYHIKLVSSKLSKALYMLRCVKKILPEKALKAIYYSLFHSNMIYCLPVWSSASQSCLSILEKLQKSAIRIINNASYNAHTERLFKKSGILPLSKLILFFNLQLMQKYIQGFLPTAFANTWITNQERRDDGIDNMQLQRILRNSSNLNIPFARLAFSCRQPFINLPKTWTEFTEESIKLIRNKLEFNFKLKKYLLDQLSATVQCSRLLCPACHIRV